MLPMDDPEVYRTVLDSVPVGVYFVDRSRKILFWNSGAERITGYLRQDVVGRSSVENILGHLDGENNEIPGEALPISNVLREGKESHAQVSLRHKLGHRILVRLQAAPIRDGHGAVIGVVESFEEAAPAADLTERQSKLAAYGCLDQTSGVLNHAMVQSHLREALATYAEHLVPLSILCIGVDRLEEIRTRYGTGAAAAAIRVVGQTLESSLRPTDFVGRWMENEFLVVLTECGGDEVHLVGERLRKMVSQSKVEWWGDLLQVTVSMGAASARTEDNAETLLERAEKGLRGSFEQGGNCMMACNE